MNNVKIQITDDKKALRLEDVELRLITIHKMRFGLLQLSHDIAKDTTYDSDFYVEANEILNEMERRCWQYVNGESEHF